jgi:hypothetical protein
MPCAHEADPCGVPIVTPVLYAIFFGVREPAAVLPRAEPMRQPVNVKGT